jgi:hypothetical protein
MTCKFRTLLAIITLMVGCGTASASLNATDEATLANHVLTEDELNRLAAVMEDAQTHGKGASINPDGANSLDSLAARVDAQPGAHSMLASHGFTARAYVVTVLTTLRTALNAQTGKETNASNAAFYRAHKAKIDRMMDLGTRASSGAYPRDEINSVDAQKLGECTKVAMGAAALMPLSMRGTANSPPESRETLAKALADTATKVSAQNLKDDFRVVGEEIRRQAAAPQFTSTPRFAHGVDDLNNWLNTHCSKDALKR